MHEQLLERIKIALDWMKANQPEEYTEWEEELAEVTERLEKDLRQ